ncbi:MAG TPA: hypothetical protein VJ906_05525 [Roseovarius sp.]|nr:hypothetical protein [Roseovarius sp.]
MTFSDAVATLPAFLRLWVLWLTIVMIAVPLVLLAWRQTRRDGVVILAASVAVVVSMHWLYAQVGFVRLLGLPHVLIWTPLAVYLAMRLREGIVPAPPRIVIWIFLASILVSLAFDYTDLLRWLLGEREAMTG